MGTRTGNPRGRPKGSKNKRTAEREAAMEATAQAIADSIPEAFAGDAHALLIAIYKDPSRPIELRADAAKAAIRYEKPAMAAIELNASVSHSHEDALDQLDDEPAREGDQAEAED